VFGVHGIGGLTGTLLAGVFATSAIGGTAGLIEGHPQQLLIQLYGVAFTFVWSACSCPCAYRVSTSSRGSISRSTARRSSNRGLRNT
jgi:ammonia channel protein AmtB